MSVLSVESPSINDSDVGLGVQPYLFEPEVDSEEQLPKPESADNPSAERVGNNNWLVLITGSLIDLYIVCFGDFSTKQFSVIYLHYIL